MMRFSLSTILSIAAVCGTAGAAAAQTAPAPTTPPAQPAPPVQPVAPAQPGVPAPYQPPVGYGTPPATPAPYAQPAPYGQPYPQQPYPPQYPQRYPQYPQQYPQYPQQYPYQPGYQLYGGGTPPGYHTHDGFYLRLGLGFGYAQSTLDSDVLKAKGFAGALTASFGGAIAQNLILYGEFLGDSITEPDLTVEGVGQDSNGVSSTMFGIGGGLAYYVMPANVYFSGSLLLSGVSLDADDTERPLLQSSGGLGFSFMVGKEWWVSDNWGLGVGARFFALQAREDKGHSLDVGTTRQWKAYSLTVGLSATYN